MYRDLLSKQERPLRIDRTAPLPHQIEDSKTDHEDDDEADQEFKEALIERIDDHAAYYSTP
jgi:hypothetical protein